MVLTRSHDHEIDAVTEGSKELPTPQSLRSSSKRKRKDESMISSTSDTVTKRQKRRSTHGSVEKASKTLAAVVIPTLPQEPANVSKQNHGHQDIEMPPDPAQTDSSPATGDGGSLNEGDDASVDEGTATKHQVEHLRPQTPIEPDDALSENVPTSIPATKSKSNPKRKTKRIPKTDLRTEHSPLMDPTNHSSQNVLTRPKHAIAKHKRFSSEEPETVAPSQLKEPSPSQTINGRNTVEDIELASSEDEAPEVVSKSTELKKARSAAAEATRAVNAQRAVEKQKRRNRDNLLKLQAKATKKHTGTSSHEDPELSTSSDDDKIHQDSPSNVDIPSQQQWSSKDPLPELLPDEILAEEPLNRLPTPPPQLSIARIPVNEKRRFLDRISKPPKDIKKGQVTIRVLEDRRAILPPKVSKSSQTLRESWLAGRRGRKGNMLVERRKMRAGFVRT
ncbi:MAG: hypothetical protein Q9222_001900 [Ikaeria aurantiellina]